MNFQNRAIIAFPVAALVSVACADVSPGVATPVTMFSARDLGSSVVAAWHPTAAASSSSAESHTSSARVLHEAFGRSWVSGSATLGYSLPPSSHAGLTPQLGLAAATVKIVGTSRPMFRVVFDEYSGTSADVSNTTSIVPLPPAVFGGLAGLGVLAIGRSMIRRRRAV